MSQLFETVPIEEALEANSASTEPQIPVVLVVDDERLIADTLGAILARSGMAALVAYDGLSALALARKNPPQVLVTDVAMPGMNGIDLAIALIQSAPLCKVLLFSGHASSADLLKARNAGHDFPLLSKPIHPHDMLKRVAECLGDRLSHINFLRNLSRPTGETRVWSQGMQPAIA